MNYSTRMLLMGLALAAGSTVAGASAFAHDPSWSQPQQPFRIYGNTWYVGTKGLGAILVSSPQGHVLIDGTLEGNAALVEANVRALGFRLRDIRLILNTHPHSDHAGALARLAHDSGARVMASPAAAKALRLGGIDPEDPQYGEAPAYPPVTRITTITDGEIVHSGSLALTAHFTPGHTPGGTSWTWRSCEGGHCLSIAYVDSLTAISRDGYRFGDPRHPRRVLDFRRTLATVASLPCDVLVTPHPDASHFMQRVAERGDPHPADALVDPAACRDYAAAARARFDQRLATEARSPGGMR